MAKKAHRISARLGAFKVSVALEAFPWVWFIRIALLN